jgi:hypothetical protein
MWFYYYMIMVVINIHNYLLVSGGLLCIVSMSTPSVIIQYQIVLEGMTLFSCVWGYIRNAVIHKFASVHDCIIVLRLRVIYYQYSEYKTSCTVYYKDIAGTN